MYIAIKDGKIYYKSDLGTGKMFSPIRSFNNDSIKHLVTTEFHILHYAVLASIGEITKASVEKKPPRLL